MKAAILIITLFALEQGPNDTQKPPIAITSAEFSSWQKCADAAKTYKDVVQPELTHVWVNTQCCAK